MEHLLQTISTLLDLLYSKAVGPIFSLIGRGLDIILLRPLQIMHAPAVLQVIIIAMLTGMVSILIRRFMRVEQKDADFREKFTLRKQDRDDLHLIGDWKSRESFAKVIDEDIDKDFNTYLAQRFTSHGVVYLLPIFFVLFWLERAVTTEGFLIMLPQNRFGFQGISFQFVFLLTYCIFLISYFRLRRSQRKTSG